MDLNLSERRESVGSIATRIRKSEIIDLNGALRGDFQVVVRVTDFGEQKYIT
jgi:hypothetical protein